MAEYCRSMFGDALLIDPLEKYPVSSSPQKGQFSKLQLSNIINFVVYILNKQNFEV